MLNREQKELLTALHVFYGLRPFIFSELVTVRRTLAIDTLGRGCSIPDLIDLGLLSDINLEQFFLTDTAREKIQDGE